MAFFGLPERDLRHSLEDPLEDVAVYTWGEDGYDGLGDALQEARDDFNDETFGSVGPVGKDFDFAQGHPDVQHEVFPQHHQRSSEIRQEQPYRQEERLEQGRAPTRPVQTTRNSTNSLEALWHDHSAFSVLPRVNGSSRMGDQARASPGPAQTQAQRFSSPFGNASPITSQAGGQVHQSQMRGRTLQEIEAEMLANAQQLREREHREQEEFLLQQELQQERLLQRQLAQQQHQQQQLLLQQQQQQRQREEEIRQRLLYQQEQQQAQRLLQQRDQIQQRSTPPPRMMPSSQSPRFLEHHRKIQLLQQQREEEQRQRLQQLEEQLRLEELERQMMAVNLDRGRVDSPLYNSRRTAGYTSAELQEAQLLQQAHERQLQLQQQQQQQHYRRQDSRSPAINSAAQYAAALQQEGFHPQNLQLQQKLLADLAHGEFPRELHGISQADQEALRLEAMRKIVEAERMEEKRRRKAAKIAYMARYNDLMTQSDKDFITRIQVSQLVTQDPYADDFYAQVYGAILRSRMGIQTQDERVLKFGSGGGIGLGLASKGGSRRPSAMQRMEQQVERIVSNARKREEEKGLHALHSLQGALGKTSGRSYKAAPRQLLQVDAGNAPSPTLSHATATAHISKNSSLHEGAAKEAAKLGREALGVAADTDNLVRKEPLTTRQTLVILEELYDTVLRVEQLRRDQPPAEDEIGSLEWKAEYDTSVDRLWTELRVMVPLETSDPHPFISLLTPTKGKKILPRLTRHLTNQRMLTLLTLLVACFSQLDVVHTAPLLDVAHETQERADAERQTQAFLGSVMQSILPVVSVANLRLVTGLLGLLLDRSDVVVVAQTRPGLALLTLFLSRVEVIKQTIATSPDLAEAPTIEESQQWRMMFDHLFQLLAPHLLLLFPSSRIIVSSTSPSHPSPTTPPPLPLHTDTIDQPVWQFLAALALHGVIEQHHILVASLREKILDNVMSVNKGWVADEEERRTKLANVNLFLHAVNLDSSQIAL